MRTVRSALAAALVVSALSIGAATADPGNKIIDASMASIGANQATLFTGVTGGGIPWRLDRGDAKVFADGHVVVDVEGLVLAAGAAEGTNPFPTGRAIVSCNNGADIVMTDLVPYSPDGNASVDTHVSLPSSCLGPLVFFAGQTGGGPRWFAVTGR